MITKRINSIADAAMAGRCDHFLSHHRGFFTTESTKSTKEERRRRHGLISLLYSSSVLSVSSVVNIL